MNFLLRHAVWALPLLSTAPHLASSAARVETARSQDPVEDPAETPPEKVESEEEHWTQEKLEAVTLEIQAQIEELRDAKFTKPVKVALTDQAGLVKYAKERSASTTPPEALEASETISKMLGLITADVDLFQASIDMIEGQAGGFYDPGTETFYLMERFATGGAAKIVLAHELTHALDDQLHDLDGPLRGGTMTTDEQLAYHALIEGSGMAAMQQWMMKHPKEWGMEDIEASQAMTQDSMVGVPQVVWKPLLASYLAGDAFLRRSTAIVNMLGTVVKKADVLQAFEAPPLSTEHVLHPKKYWESELRDNPHAIAFEIGELPVDWAVTQRDTLGELMLSLVTTPLEERGDFDMADPLAVMKLSFTNDSAAGWGGDRFVLLENEKGSILRGVTVWDTQLDADEFVRAIQSIEPHFTTSLFALAEHRGVSNPGDSGLRLHRVSGRVVELTLTVGVEETVRGQVLGAVRSSVQPL